MGGVRVRSLTAGLSAAPPPAAGTRLAYLDLPERLRRVIDDALGSPVRSAVTAVGGFSPGVAARVRCADGSRAFVKAVSAAQNPDTPRLLRMEAAIAADLPETVPAPRLRFDYDNGDWVVLAFDDVEGSTPPMPWTLDDAHAVLATVAQMLRTLSPSPLPHAPTALDHLRGDLLSWTRLAADPPPDLDPWERAHLDRLASLGEAVVVPDGPMSGMTLLHLDLRADNILIGPDRQVTVVDWPWGSLGPAWADPLILGVDLLVYGHHDPEPLLTEHGLLDSADPDGVTGFLLGLAGMWAEAYRRPPPPGLGTLRPFQRAFHDAALAWGRRRAGWS